MGKKTPILHLVCGLPGSGKTTLSKKIESSLGAIRFCPDEWIKDIWSSETEGNTFRERVEKLQWKIGKDLLRKEKDIIIEWGTWGKSERIKLRDEAWEIGAKVKFYYLDMEKEVLKERIIKRNNNLESHEFLMPKETLDKELERCFNLIEMPDIQELKSYDLLG